MRYTQGDTTVNMTTGSNLLGGGGGPDCDNCTIYFTTVRPSSTEELDIFTRLSHEQRILFTVIICAVMLFTTIGNLLTILAVLSGKYLKAVSYLFIASLATADLIIGGFVMPFKMLYTVTYEGMWTFGPIVCDFWQFVDYVGRTASLTNLCTIALDRCMTVSRPLKSIHTRTRKRAVIMIAVSWMIPITHWLVFITLVRTVNDDTEPTECTLIWKPFYLVIIAASMTVYIPILIILVLFTLIFLSLREHAKRLSRRLRRRSLNSTNISFEESSTSEALLKSPGSRKYSSYGLFNCFYTYQKSKRRARCQSTDESDITDRVSGKNYDLEYDVLVFHNSRRRSVRFRNAATNTSAEWKFGRTCRSVGTNTSLQNACSETISQLPYPRTRSEPDINSKVNRYDTLGTDLLTREQSLKGKRSHSVGQDESCKPFNPKEKVTWRKYAEVMQKCRQDSLEKSRLAQQIRAAKTLTVTMVFILLCWLPFAIVWPVHAYCPECLSIGTYNLTFWINYLNAAINPIVYCLCNPTIRRAFRHMIRRR